jgi:hypothetical protein
MHGGQVDLRVDYRSIGAAVEGNANVCTQLGSNPCGFGSVGHVTMAFMGFIGLA